MRAEGVDILFLGLSADLEYLSGVERGIPFFGQSSYAHGWVAGGFFRPDADPVFVLPRMVAAFDLPVRPDGEIVIVNETDDGFAVFERVAKGLGRRRPRSRSATACGRRRPSISATSSASTGSAPGRRSSTTLRRVKSPEELEAMARACRTVEQTMDGRRIPRSAGRQHGRARRGGRASAPARRLAHALVRDAHLHGARSGQPRLSTLATGARPMPEGTSVMFDFGGVVDGYCSDFGRTVVAGEPSQELLDAYDVMLAAYEAGRDACRPGALAREVNAACRAPIEEAGLGPYFRHRMGHGIGLDVHERPFVSSEDETPLEAGMTFTDEPSIIIPNAFSVRIENIIVCDEQGGRVLNDYSDALVWNG